ncbi:hypothetical protein BJ508DRAFT_418381 [Ascobolus immersus RN42]|uniref:Uncharacterized protein n=1 Tax=Ascobolus immersus RN42 TaxID=1160509 RepID=A0A3N4HS78_ASCIM|nr:hypothetical protein BJ508DRAFT_418381 [Ascobolus immersus RN42]
MNLAERNREYYLRLIVDENIKAEDGHDRSYSDSELSDTEDEDDGKPWEEVYGVVDGVPA